MEAHAIAGMGRREEKREREALKQHWSIRNGEEAMLELEWVRMAIVGRCIA